MRLESKRKGNTGSIPIWSKIFFYFPKPPTECATGVKQTAREGDNSPPKCLKGWTCLSHVPMACMRALLSTLCWRVYVALHKQFYKRSFASATHIVGNITDCYVWRQAAQRSPLFPFAVTVAVHELQYILLFMSSTHTALLKVLGRFRPVCKSCS